MRFAEIEVETRAGLVEVVIDLDGGSKQDVRTGDPLVDRWLRTWARAARFDLGLSVELAPGCLPTDIAPEVGSALGQAFRRSLSQSDRIEGLGSAIVPVGRALVLAAVDVLRRALPEIEGVGPGFVEPLLTGFSLHGELTLHVRSLADGDGTDRSEAVSIALGLALSHATRRVEPASAGFRERRT